MIIKTVTTMVRMGITITIASAVPIDVAVITLVFIFVLAIAMVLVPTFTIWMIFIRLHAIVSSTVRMAPSMVVADPIACVTYEIKKKNMHEYICVEVYRVPLPDVQVRHVPVDVGASSWDIPSVVV